MVGYRDYNGVNVTIARIFNTYGPRMLANDGRVVSNFICQVLEGKDLTVYGDGSQTRSFCYVSDMVGGLIRLMDSSETGPINLGNPHEVTVKDLADMVLKMIPGTGSEVVYKPLPADDPTRRRPDISLARRALGWSPQVSLAEGLQAAIAYFRKELGHAHDRP
jgi:UDP-glucuronate decarboxylase